VKTKTLTALAAATALAVSLIAPATASGVDDPAAEDVVASSALTLIPDVPQVIPVLTCARATRCGSNFTVTLTDANGVQRTTSTGDGAGALFLADGLTTPIEVTVEVGRLARRGATLHGYIGDDLTRGTGVDLVSTVAHAIAEQSGTSMAAAMAEAARGLRIDADLTFSQRIAGVGDFSPGSFLARARKKGGVDRFINEVVVPKILDGKSFDFSGTPRVRTPRSVVQLTDSVLDAAGADSDLSGFLGLPNPAKEISDAIDELVTAITQGFATLGAMITALMREEQETQYQIYVNTLSNLTSATVDNVEQLQFMANMDLQDDTDLQTYGYYRDQVYNDIAEKVDSEYALYEPTLLYNIVPLSEGLLQAGHDVAQATQKYYVAEDVNNLQGLVEYWGAMAAASNLLIVNALSVDPSVPDASRATVMLNQNNTAGVLNSNIMLAMPEDLGSAEVGSWEADEAYAIVGAKNVPYKWMTQMAKWGNADCDNFKTTSSSGVSGVVFVSQDEIQEWWRDMAESELDGGTPIYSLASGAQAGAILSNSRYDSAAGTSVTALEFLQGIAAQRGTAPRAAVTSDTVHVLGRRDADNSDGGYKGAKLCTAIDMPIGLTAINSEIKYDKKNSIDTTAFSQRSVQLAPNWAALR